MTKKIMKKMKMNMNKLKSSAYSFVYLPVLTIIGLILVAALAYGGFCLYRWVNWTFFYDNRVEQKIIEMVKPECLALK